MLDATYDLMRFRATLVITHRLVRLEEVDEILVLGGGRIIERGTHEELIPNPLERCCIRSVVVASFADKYRPLGHR